MCDIAVETTAVLDHGMVGCCVGVLLFTSFDGRLLRAEQVLRLHRKEGEVQ